MKIITSSVLSDDMEILTDVNVKEVGTTNRTTTDAAGRFSFKVASEDSQLEFSHAGYDFDTFRAGDITAVVTLYPHQLDGAVVTNAFKKDNTFLWVIAAAAATFAAMKLFGKSKPQPRKIKI